MSVTSGKNNRNSKELKSMRAFYLNRNFNISKTVGSGFGDSMTRSFYRRAICAAVGVPGLPIILLGWSVRELVAFDWCIHFRINGFNGWCTLSRSYPA